MSKIDPCPIRKCGEFNMLKCVMDKGHEGNCIFVVDRENDYPHNKKRNK